MMIVFFRFRVGYAKTVYKIFDTYHWQLQEENKVLSSGPSFSQISSMKLHHPTRCTRCRRRAYVVHHKIDRTVLCKLLEDSKMYKNVREEGKAN
jgi:hypothetical protein